MKNKEKLEKALALIIKCTRRIKRPKDIVTLAKNISYAEKCLGNLDNVAQAVGISVQQLKDFLKAKKLCSEVKALVKKRAIDSVDIVKILSTLPYEKQKALANYLIKGLITSKDVRIISTYAKKFPRKSIEKVITNYEKTRDTRLYVIKFRLPTEFNDQNEFLRRFEKIVGKNEIKKFQLEKRVLVLEITTLGHKKLREAVRKKQITLRKYIESIIKN